MDLFSNFIQSHKMAGQLPFQKKSQREVLEHASADYTPLPE